MEIRNSCITFVKKFRTMYVIVKHIKNKSGGRRLPVIILNVHDEILEFDKENEAQQQCDIFNQNSDSGHVYEVKKL